MDKDLFETGLEKRKATLGAEYVQKSLDGVRSRGTRNVVILVIIGYDNMI